MENNNKKLDIKSLLEQNNMNLNNHVKEDKIENVIDNDNVNAAEVENANESFGQVVENKDVMKHAGYKGGGISGNIITPEQMADIEASLRAMDIQIAEAQEQYEQYQEQQELEEQRQREIEEQSPLSVDEYNPDSFAVEEPDNVVVEETMDDGVEKKEDFLKRYQEAVVVIDKTGMGQVINFTDEEREKMKKVKSITLKEVETVELKSIKTKKAKTGIADRILQKRNTVKNTTVVLPISGLTMVMKGCSTFELMGLINGDQVNVMTLVSKWTLIHSKVESTSIGKMDFNTFLNNVASLEYDILVYGILCATFPDEDTFPLTCPLCKTSIEHKYEMRSLLRAEEMSDDLAELVRFTADSSYTENAAKQCFENSILNTEKSIQLPDSEFICTIGVQNAYSFIYESVNAIDKLDDKYSQATIISSAVPRIFVPNPDDGGDTYLEIDDTEDKIKLIYSLNAKDISILSTKIGELTNGLEFKFGLMDINCPNMKCKHHVNSVEVELDTILFHKYQQAMNTTIE